MKIAIRANLFETNSSSEHAFIVFEDQGVLDAWQSEPDLFLDLNDVEWIDGDIRDWWKEPHLDVVATMTSDNLIDSTSERYREAIEYIEATGICDFGGYDPQDFLMWEKLAAYPRDEYSDCAVKSGMDIRSESVLKDERGREIFEIRYHN